MKALLFSLRRAKRCINIYIEYTIQYNIFLVWSLWNCSAVVLACAYSFNEKEIHRLSNRNSIQCQNKAIKRNLKEASCRVNYAVLPVSQILLCYSFRLRSEPPNQFRVLQLSCSGLPQGSALQLGPLVFFLHTTPLSCLIEFSSVDHHLHTYHTQDSRNFVPRSLYSVLMNGC